MTDNLETLAGFPFRGNVLQAEAAMTEAIRRGDVGAARALLAEHGGALPLKWPRFGGDWKALDAPGAMLYALEWTDAHDPTPRAWLNAAHFALIAMDAPSFAALHSAGKVPRNFFVSLDEPLGASLGTARQVLRRHANAGRSRFVRAVCEVCVEATAALTEGQRKRCRVELPF